MEMPTIEEMAKNVANTALDDICYKGKTIREWAKLICSLDIPENPTNGDVFKAVFSTFAVEINSDWVACWINPHETIGFDLDWWNSPYQEGGNK